MLDMVLGVRSKRVNAWDMVPNFTKLLVGETEQRENHGDDLLYVWRAMEDFSEEVTFQPRPKG